MEQKVVSNFRSKVFKLTCYVEKRTAGIQFFDVLTVCFWWVLLVAIPIALLMAQQQQQVVTMELQAGDPDEILKLDVGGTVLRVRRCVLTQVDDSMMATRFSGRWDGAKEKHGQGDSDADPSFFIPYPCEIFKPLVDLLSLRYYVPGCEACKLNIDDFDGNSRRYHAFLRLTEHYGLLEALYGSPDAPTEDSIYFGTVENGKITETFGHWREKDLSGQSTMASETIIQTRDVNTFGIRAFKIHIKERRGVQYDMKIGWTNLSTAEFVGFKPPQEKSWVSSTWTIEHVGDWIILSGQDNAGSLVFRKSVQSFRVGRKDPNQWVATFRAHSVQQVSDVKLRLL